MEKELKDIKNELEQIKDSSRSSKKVLDEVKSELRRSKEDLKKVREYLFAVTHISREMLLTLKLIGDNTKKQIKQSLLFKLKNKVKIWRA